MYVMCCRRLRGYMSYQEAISEAIYDKISCCRWIRHLVHFLIVSSICYYHFVRICSDYMNICELVGDKVLRMKNVEKMKYIRSVVMIPITIVFSLGKLKSLGFASLLGLFYFILCKWILLFRKTIQNHIFSDHIVGEVHSFQREPYIPDSEMKQINFPYFPLALASSSISSTFSIGVFLFIEQECENPENFVKPFGILNIGLVISTITHIIFGGVGYFMYGVNTRNLKFEISEVFFGKAITLGYVFTTVITFAINGYSVSNIIWNEVLKKILRNRSNQYLWQMLMRFSICLIVGE